MVGCCGNRGEVGPVDGLPEKMCIAADCGVRMAIVPAEDSTYMPSEFEAMEIKGAGNVFELMKLALEGE